MCICLVILFLDVRSYRVVKWASPVMKYRINFSTFAFFGLDTYDDTKRGLTTGAATALYSSSSRASRLDGDDNSFFASRNKFTFATVDAGFVESNLLIRFIAVFRLGISPLV